MFYLQVQGKVIILHFILEKIWGQVLQYNKGYAILVTWPDHYG